MIPSISCSRTSRQREAPSALRTEISWARSGAARQRQVRQVRARDQQDHDHAGQDHPGDGVGRFRVRRTPPHSLSDPTRGPGRSPLRVGGVETLPNQGRLTVGAGQHDAALQSAPDLDGGRAAVDQVASAARTPASPAGWPWTESRPTAPGTARGRERPRVLTPTTSKVWPPSLIGVPTTDGIAVHMRPPEAFGQDGDTASVAPRPRICSRRPSRGPSRIVREVVARDAGTEQRLRPPPAVRDGDGEHPADAASDEKLDCCAPKIAEIQPRHRRR